MYICESQHFRILKFLYTYKSLTQCLVKTVYVTDLKICQKMIF